MKTKVTQATCTFAFGPPRRLLSRVVWLGALILICASAFAQNLFVSGNMPPKNCFGGCGVIYKFTWDGGQTIFASGLLRPWDVAFDSAGNLFVVDYNGNGLGDDAVIYKMTPNGVRTTFASGLNYPASLAVDGAGNVFAADYNRGTIYRYKPTGSRTIFASGLYHPVGMAFDSSGKLFVADSSIGEKYQAGIYQYKPDGSRTTFALLEASDQPADLAFDNLGNLFMADLGGNVYKYNVYSPLRRQGRTIFGSVPNSAQSLAFDNAGNLLVVDSGDFNITFTAVANAVYKFTQQGVRSTFASGHALDERFACLAFRPMACCQ